MEDRRDDGDLPRLIYLSGATNEHTRRAAAEGWGIGLMAQPGNSQHNDIPNYRWWAADNGCFADRWNSGKWLDWLCKRETAGCLFAVAPDVMGDAVATLERSSPYLTVIRKLGFPAALVAQDGLHLQPVPWDEFDALFIGGTTVFKLSPEARALCTEARARGKWVHMGRVNSWARLHRAALWGCHSVDGTFVGFGPDRRTPELVSWLRRLEGQGGLF